MKEVINLLPCSAHTIRKGDTLFHIAKRYNTTVKAISEANPGMDPDHLYIGQTICIPSSNHTAYSDMCFTKTQVDLINKIRELWEEHIAWTRMTIISMASDAPDTELVTNRLLRNPSDFAALLRPLYGNNTASRFESLFKSHLVIAAQLVNAAKSGDSRAAADAERRWYENADEIAAFLASINPYWSKEEWKTMMHEHLSLTKSEAVNRLQGNYANDIMIYDEIQKQAMEMADIMSFGIMKQFPNIF